VRLAGEYAQGTLEIRSGEATRPSGELGPRAVVGAGATKAPPAAAVGATLK